MALAMGMCPASQDGRKFEGRSKVKNPNALAVRLLRPRRRGSLNVLARVLLSRSLRRRLLDVADNPHVPRGPLLWKRYTAAGRHYYLCRENARPALGQPGKADPRHISL